MNLKKGITKLADKRSLDMGIEAKEIDARIMYDIKRVEAIREWINDDGIPEGTIIYLKSGESLFVSDTFDHISRILSDANK